MTFADHVERIGYRGPGFDRIRLIAALIVVLHHCSFYSMESIADDFLSAASGGAIDFGRLAVNIFFVTSGVLVAPGLLRSGDLTSFAVNRGLRVMPALIVVVGVTVFAVGPLITRLPASQYFTDPQAYLYLKNMAFRAVRYLPGVETSDGTAIIVNGALWTIFFEILSYLTLAVLFVAGVTRRPALLAILFAITYAVYAYSYLLPANPLRLPETLLVYCQLFLYFLAGVIIAALSARIPYSGTAAFGFAVVTLLAFPLGVVYYVLPISLSYVVAYLGYSDRLGRRSLRIDLSYGIYLIHSVVITFLIVMVPQIDNFFAGTVVVLATTLLLSFLSWTFIEDPCLRRKALAKGMIQRLLPALRTKQPGRERPRTDP